ncbi:hypothetical protein [Pseudobacteriovorax antillogorgiicola]|uniref:Uncharacterized protein n=1 Tax=Pseudobacteriovorax antillogorgiicola TaxID=1513793 RepID=A0A1Y6BA66_9BACT|nr:hypothetical protein [Pseudobacteriovorax antillogorgiicola]TCS57447.1 hypothetical protein EDD56_103187 [Pseudobacteriovorax antillogorgiicola]SMF00905.1 hypothetical protein SAMN06296036_103146 [Pseudobacteriovorax antillogorgiicola]
MRQVLVWAFALGALWACEEKNPYANRVATAEQSAATPEGQVSSGNQTGATPEEQTQEAENLSEEALTVTQLICQSNEFSGVQAAFDAACVNGQASVALATALEQPYDGAGDPVINLLQSDDVNGVSQFLVITSLKVAVSPADVLAQANALNEADFSEGNATVTQTEISSVAGDGAPIMLSTEIQFDLNVSVGIINVNDVRILSKEFLVLDSETQLMGYRSVLKAGEPDNEDNILANQISFWVPQEDGSTVLITISQQHADNRGQHATAETTFQGVARRSLLDTYALFGGQ